MDRASASSKLDTALRQAWYIEMLKSGNMEQLCWNNVFARTMVDNQSSIADPYCRYKSDELNS